MSDHSDMTPNQIAVEAAKQEKWTLARIAKIWRPELSIDGNLRALCEQINASIAAAGQDTKRLEWWFRHDGIGFYDREAIDAAMKSQQGK